KKRMTLNDLLNKYSGKVDPDSIFAIYNRYNYGSGTNKKGYGDVQESPETLSRWGITKGIPSATEQKAKEKAKEDAAIHVNALRGFGNLMKSYYSGSTKVGQMGTMLDPNARKRYEAANKVYIGQLQKSLGVGRGKYNFESLMSSLPGENVAFGYEGAFQGHLSSLLDNAGQVIYRDKKTGETGVSDITDVDMTKDDIIDPMSTSGDTLMKILNGL
ncbi:MAG: hypothetical protein PHE73_09445, partial [Sulfurovaceae bacterium]|nr:hypothetical protein [Sulfurovaceae bacterium]